MTDPEEVTIVVHSAMGLQGKRPGHHKYSVIFGLGGTKFRTMVVKEPSGNPVWNEESSLHVSNVLDQLFFIVTEKDDILGHLTIPVTSLKAVKGQIKTAPLQPHKKCPNPQGFLTYQCFVLKYRPPGDHLPIIKNESLVHDNDQHHSTLQQLWKGITSPATQKRISNKEQNGHKGSLSGFNTKISKSIQDLFSFNKFSTGNSLDIDDDSIDLQTSEMYKSKNKKKFSLKFLSMSNDLDQTGNDLLIASCTPSSGPIGRPTRLTIEGQNLAMGKSDILSLKVAGCDCTDTLEFESSNRIYCTTHFYTVCKGHVEINTISGGVGVLKDGFSFYEELDDTENSSLNPFDNQNNGTPFKVGSQEDCSIDRLEIKSDSNTIPRTRGASLTPMAKLPITSTLQPLGHNLNYGRRPSEAPSEASIHRMKTPIEHVSKEELQAKADQLEAENAELKRDNNEMKRYIDKLVAKCIVHCPEALAQDGNEKSRLFVQN